mgnify:CR=1 FL=1
MIYATRSFFRYPDRTLLGRESIYQPPVEDNTASQASLQLDYVLSQDAYGARANLAVGGSVLPIPDLAVGRLVESPTDIVTMLATYDQLDQSSGGIVRPQSALVTGYDFLEDGALAMVDTLRRNGGVSNIDAELIVDQKLPPAEGWSAGDLRPKLVNNRHDLIYLAGHFSANSVLAADYETYLITTDLAGSDVLTNAIVFSPGCHSGYNIVNEHNLPGYTFEPDWAQAFARKGATLVAGTGYQYGDTEFVEYSERLYLNFAQELRTRPAGQTVAIGQALVRAKQSYLAGTPFLRGMHEKALLEAALFGLPMLQVDMPGAPFAPPSDASIVTGTTPVPGNGYGLETAEVALTPNTIVRAMDVNNLDTGSGVTLTWLQGKDGVVTNHAEPVLPRHVENVSVPGKVLRGVGFISAAYADDAARPLVGRPTTELAPLLSSFSYDIFFPTRPWNVNYFEALSRGQATRLMVLPAQVRTDGQSNPNDPLSIRRKYEQMSFRLYYLGDQVGTVDLVDAPTIVSVAGNLAETFDAVTFDVAVVSDPLVPTGQVWVTYTGLPGHPFFGRWQSLELAQTDDARLWRATLPLNPANDPGDIRFIVQACNAAGLCSLAANRGAYFTPGQQQEPQPTALALAGDNPTSGVYGASATFRARLTDANGLPVANQFVAFILGSEQRRAKTDGNGLAQVSLPLLALPDANRDGQPDEQLLRATFGGAAEFAASFDTQLFTINKQDTGIQLSTLPGTVTAALTGRATQPGGGVFNRPLGEETIFFIVRDQRGDIHQRAAVITNFEGRASLKVNPPRGEYNVFAYYSGPIPRPPASPDVELMDERYNPSAEAIGVVVVENSPPTAVDDAYTFSGPLTITAPGVLANDSDVDLDPLAVTRVVTGPISGALTLATDGGFSYTPTVKFHGSDSFVYEISDTGGLTDTATVTLKPSLCFFAEISPPQAALLWPPNGSLREVTVTVAGAEVTIVSVFQDEPVGKVQDAFIIDHDTVQLRAKRLGQGNGRVYHIFFMADDGQGNVCASSVRVGVLHDQRQPFDPALLDAADDGPLHDSTVPSNMPPQAIDDRYTTTEETLLTIAAAGVLGNDQDLDGDPLNVAAVNGNPAGVGLQVSLSSNALLRLNSDGSFQYDPNRRFDDLAAGGLVTDTFSYHVSDGSDVSTTTVVITITGVNNPPTAVADQAATDEGTPLLNLDLLSNDTDPDDAVLSIVSLDTAAAIGQVTLTNGRVDYDPRGRFDDLAAGAAATDSFSYTVSDPAGATATATVTIIITGLAEPPVAVDDQAATDEDTSLSNLNVLGNDLNPAGTGLTVAGIDTTNSRGLVTLNPDGTINYNPNGQFESLAVGEQAMDSFSYTASNGAGNSSATVRITVNGVNDSPTAVDDQAATAEDQPVTIAVLGNDSDPDSSDTLAVVSVDTAGTRGLVTNNGDGAITYNPNGQFDDLTAGQQAVDTFSYTVSDGHGGTASARVTVTISGIGHTNTPPGAGDDAYNVAVNETLTISAPGVLSNDNDADGDPLTANLVTGPANGALTLNADGSFTYSPNPDFNGVDAFTYQASDGAEFSNVATVTITVGP